MIRHQIVRSSEIPDDEWVTFPGGELEGRRPRVLCPACRERQRKALKENPEAESLRSRPRISEAAHHTLCFECYRVDLARERALRAARSLNTASEDRFQASLPFEPVNRPRLERLRAERATARAATKIGNARFVDKRRRAQIAARHALQRMAAGLQSRGIERSEQDRATASAIHAAEVQLPDAWLPFVVSR